MKISNYLFSTFLFFTTCNDSLLNIKSSHIDHILKGIAALNHDGNTSLAIPEFNKSFANVNNNITIVSVIEDLNTDNQRWEFYQMIESQYGDNGSMIRMIDTSISGGVRKSVDEYFYEHGLLREKIEENMHWDGQIHVFSEVYEYDRGDRIKSDIRRSKSNDKWEDYYKSFYSYDSLERIEEFWYQRWSGLHEKWNDGYKEIYSFWEDSTVIYQYQQAEDNFELYRRIDSIFNEERKLVRETIYSYENNKWNISQETKYLYNELNMKIEEFYYDYKDSSGYKKEYKYNSHNQIISEKTSFNFKDLVDTYIEEYIYNNEGFLEEVIIDNDIKYVFKYDYNGFISKISLHTFYENVNKYFEVSRIVQKYF